MKFVDYEDVGCLFITRRMGCCTLFGWWALKLFTVAQTSAKLYTQRSLVLSEKPLSWEAGFLGKLKESLWINN